MKVAVGLRPLPNKTNSRSLALSEALQEAGHEVVYQGRGEPVKGAQMYVQTGFGRSRALLSAIEQEIPYIIMEAACFRDMDVESYSSWGYNGLQGGAWRPPNVPDEPRESPTLQPEHGGGQLIIGQKPTDHSLRGSDHVSWIVQQRLAFPEADFRPHPLMVPHGTLEPIAEVLERYGEVYTYSSTVAVDAIVAGCKAYADSDYSLLRHFNGDREEFIHRLSWWQSHHRGFGELIEYILDGYEEAEARMAAGLYEVPREKVNGLQVCSAYYQRVLC